MKADSFRWARSLRQSLRQMGTSPRKRGKKSASRWRETRPGCWLFALKKYNASERQKGRANRAAFCFEGAERSSEKTNRLAAQDAGVLRLLHISAHGHVTELFAIEEQGGGIASAARFFNVYRFDHFLSRLHFFNGDRPIR